MKVKDNLKTFEDYKDLEERREKLALFIDTMEAEGVEDFCLSYAGEEISKIYPATFTVILDALQIELRLIDKCLATIENPHPSIGWEL